LADFGQVVSGEVSVDPTDTADSGSKVDMNWMVQKR
jgi:hypothetical protein